MKAITKKCSTSKKTQAEAHRSEKEITEELCRSIKRKQKSKPANSMLKPAIASGNKPVSDSVKRVKSSNKKKGAKKSRVNRDKNGHILPGSGSNGGGRPKGSLSGVRVSEIRQAMSKVALERRKPEKKRKFNTWLEHQINRSYDDSSLATTIFNKTYPTLKSIEQVTLDGGSMSAEERENLRAEYGNMRFED